MDEDADTHSVAAGKASKTKRQRAATDTDHEDGVLVATTATIPSQQQQRPRRRPKLIWRARDQENSRLYNLQLDVTALQSEMQGMQQYRNLLMHRALNKPDDFDGSYVKIVQEYFRVFRHGYTTNTKKSGQRKQYLLNADATTGESVPDAFVDRVVDANVMIGRFSGLHQMMKQWQRYTAAFAPMQLSFIDAHVIPTTATTTATAAAQASSDRDATTGDAVDRLVSVTSRAQYHLYISLQTIEDMFPHLLAQPEIVTMILGRRIRGIGKFDFVFDPQSNRIIQYEFSLDLLGSFLELLGDPTTTVVLLNDALISDESFIGDLSEFVPVVQEVSPAETEWSGSITGASSSAGSITFPEPAVAATGQYKCPLSSPTTQQQQQQHHQQQQPWQMKISTILATDDNEIIP